jgi:hypothetical protein
MQSQMKISEKVTIAREGITGFISFNANLYVYFQIFILAVSIFIMRHTAEMAATNRRTPLISQTLSWLFLGSYQVLSHHLVSHHFVPYHLFSIYT